MTFKKNQSALCPRLEIQAEQPSTPGKGKASFSPPVSLAKGNFIAQGFGCVPPNGFHAYPCEEKPALSRVASEGKALTGEMGVSFP